jgi:NhaP-type Na+/H+ or K+/H+ antiporter
MRAAGRKIMLSHTMAQTPMETSPVTILSGMAVLALCCQWLAWRLRVPSILFLLLAGFALGPVAGWLDPDRVFGELLFPVISLSVAVILFEGGLTLRFENIRGLEVVVRRLVTVGILVTFAVTALAAHWLLPFTWKTALLFSAITVVTGPTVIVPLLRTVRPAAKVAHILRWEGILIDPIGALLAVLVFEFIVAGAGEAALGHMLAVLAQMLATGLVLGSAAGFGFGQILRQHWLPEYLHNVAALAIVLGVFALADSIQSESGLLAVTLMGVWLANMKQVPVEDILNFKESLSVLLISYLFLILAARIDSGDFTRLGWESIGVLLIMQFVARPLKVLVSTWSSALSWRERLLLAWIAPRGVVAAAVAAVFAIDMPTPGCWFPRPFWSSSVPCCCRVSPPAGWLWPSALPSRKPRAISSSAPILLPSRSPRPCTIEEFRPWWRTATGGRYGWPVCRVSIPITAIRSRSMPTDIWTWSASVTCWRFHRMASATRWPACVTARSSAIMRSSSCGPARRASADGTLRPYPGTCASCSATALPLPGWNSG